jgi:hypothetical protein
MFFRPASLKQGLAGVSDASVILEYGDWLAEQGQGLAVYFNTAPEVEFTVATPSNVVVRGSHDVALEFSFTDVFTDIVGTGTPTNGLLTAAITAAVGDIADPATLYCRNVDGTIELANLACVVVAAE